MAQWLGQFTGRTHATKVRHLEDLLRNAIDSARVAPNAELPKRLRNIKSIAEHLLSSRVKMLKRRGSDKVEETVEGGVDAILDEFEFEFIFEGRDS